MRWHWKVFWTTGSVGICNVLSEPACAWTPHGFNLYGFPSTMGAVGECPEFYSKQHLRLHSWYSLEVISWRIFHERILPQDSGGFTSDCLFLGELPKAIESHQPVCQLYHYQLGPTKWSFPMTKSLDPIVDTALRWVSHGKASDPPFVELPTIVRCQRRGQCRRQGLYVRCVHCTNSSYVFVSIICISIHYMHWY